MTDGLFHVDGTGGMTAMSVTPYQAESVLQDLVENHPDLLAGGQIDPSSPRRWLLVKREQGVPDEEDRPSRWSIDHLFVDQDAVPTLVEVKRSTDTRIRREVVGQMLDYAANGVRFWPLADLRVAYEGTQRSLGRDPLDEVVQLTVDAEATVEEFFERVLDNLRSGRIRMLFVADVIPKELRAIVEFLNEQLDPAEVFAVEVKQYRAEGQSERVLVPHVFGRTEAAAASKHHGATEQMSREEMQRRASQDTRAVIEEVTALAAQSDDLTTRETRASLQLRTGRAEVVAAVYLNYDTVDIQIQPLRDRGFEAEADELLQTLQRVSSKSLPPKSPPVPTADAMANWDTVSEVLKRSTALFARAQAKS